MIIPIYKSFESTTIYRDGGSLELRFIGDDNECYCVFISVVSDSPDDCKRYHQPKLLKGSFYINNIKPEDLICLLTWQQLSALIDSIKLNSTLKDKEKFGTHLSLIEKISKNNGWLVN